MKAVHREDLVFLAGKRTPFGTYGGALKDVSATDLAVHAARAALAQSGVAPAEVGHVVFGNVLQTSPDAIYLTRHVGLRAGVPQEVPALTVNRLCGSGFEAVVQGALQLLTGQAEAVLVGGTESMSEAPFLVRGARFGVPLGKSPPVEDMLWSGLTDSWAGMPMAMTAEKLAEQYRIGQDEVDAFSVRSQERFAAAQAEGRLDDEIAPMELETRKGPVPFARDEHPRPGTTVEALRKLPKVFKKDGVIHAGAASGVSDGAGALVLSTRAFAERKGLAPIARLVNWGVAGVDPTIMGIGPVPAFRNALARAEARLSDIDLFEVNEAFAPQVLAVEKELGLPPDRTNVDGGAIAVGHPLAASGARLTMHTIYALRRRGLRFGLAGACSGGGLGSAVMVAAGCGGRGRAPAGTGRRPGRSSLAAPVPPRQDDPMEARMESFTGCKVFTTTLARDREAMSDKITQWLQAHPDLEIVDKTVTLSSDRQFHCLSIVFFYRERGGAR